MSENQATTSKLHVHTISMTEGNSIWVNGVQVEDLNIRVLLGDNIEIHPVVVEDSPVPYTANKMFRPIIVDKENPEFKATEDYRVSFEIEQGYLVHFGDKLLPSIVHELTLFKGDEFHLIEMF